MTTRESDKAGQGRAITRGEEARVRALLRDALNVYPSRINLYWSHDDKRMTSVSIDADGQSYRDLTREEIAKAARAGIVPGADGWCWAPSASVATPGDECIGCSHSRGSHDRSDGSCIYCNCPEFKGAAVAPPAWLTAAVLAALPCDGAPADFMGVVAHVAPLPQARALADLGAPVAAALAALVAAGDAEAVEGGQTWRRWGVPEGFRWMEHGHGVYGLDGPMPDCRTVARAHTTGRWTLVEELCGGRREVNDVATPPTLAAARTAALRACYERGVFGPRPVAAPATSTPQGGGMGEQAAPAPTRAEQVRLALLAVLTRGAVEGRSHVLAALDAAPGNLGVSSVEALQAAREIGASVDGARWSLPAMAPGWGWCPFDVIGESRLIPVGCSDPILGAVARIVLCHGVEGMRWTALGEPGSSCKSVEEGQAAALAAARRAGLFASRPAAVEVTGDGGPPVLPTVTSQGGEAVVPCRHVPTCELARSILIDRDTSRIEAKLSAWRADILAEARAVELGVIVEGPTLRVYADDGRTVVSEERIGGPLDPHPHRDGNEEPWETIERLARERDEARTSIGVAIRQRDAAERERDNALHNYSGERATSELLRVALEAAEAAHEAAALDRDAARADLAALQAGLDGLRTWATGAKGGGR